MNNATLKAADNRLDSPMRILILENGEIITYETLDFQDGGDHSDHVWLYQYNIAIACIDMRSITGVCIYPWPEADKD